MSTALSLYGNNTFTTTLATASKLFTATGGTTGNRHALIGTATGWGELYANAGAWAAAGAIGAPTGNGFLWDVTTLEAQQIIAGTWTPTLRLGINLGNGNLTADLYVRAYRYNAGTYTLIGTLSLLAQTIPTGPNNYVLAGSLGAANFVTGDKLYFDVWANITATTNTLSTAQFNTIVSSSATQGATQGFHVVTPGYQPTPTTSAVYGTNTASGTLSTASKLFTVTGGSTGNRQALIGIATGYGELYSNSGAWAGTSGIGVVSGHGFLWDVTTLEGQQIVAGTWTPTLRLGINNGNGSITADLYVRAYRYNAATGYTLIGTFSLLAQTIPTGPNNFVFAAASVAAVSFGVGDKLYLDEWANITAQANTLTTAQLNTIISTSATQGATNGFQVAIPGTQTTPTFVIPDPYGVTVGLYNTTTLLDPQTIIDMHDLGLTWIRLNPFLNQIDKSPSPHTFLWNSTATDGIHWTALDDAIAQCNAASPPIKITVALKKPPGNNSATGDWGSVATQCGTGGAGEQWHMPDPTYMVTAATAFATRYNGANGHGTIHAIEIGNEDFDEYFDAGAGPVQACRTWDWYAPVLPVVSDAIKAAYPGCLVGFFGMLWTAQPHITDFMNGMYAASPGCAGKVDFYNFHYYRPQADQLVDIPNKPYSGMTQPSFPNKWGAIQAVKTANGEAAIPIRCSEVGYDATGTTLSLATQQLYWQEILDSARLSGVVTHVDIYTMRYDGVGGPDSIVNSTKNPATYPPIYAWLKHYIATYPTWGSAPPPGSSGLSVSSGHIVDANGKQIYLRGLNTAGLEFGDGIADFTQARINAFAAKLNMNIWRLPVNVSWWNNNVLLTDGVTHYKDWIQQLIGWMKATGCYVEINPTTYVTIPPTSSGSYCGVYSNIPQSSVASDTFIHANQSGWPTSSGGAAWATLSGSATQSIASNEGVITAGEIYKQLGSSTATDQTGVVRFALTYPTDARTGILFRVASFNTYYLAYAMNGLLVLNKNVAGVDTNLVVLSRTYTSGTFYQMRVYAVGTTLYVRTWTDGTPEPNTWEIQVTDSSIASGGYGLYGKAGTGDQVQLDHFNVGTPVTSCIPQQDTLNFPPWTDAQIISATNSFYDSFIPLYSSDPAMLYDALNEPRYVPYVADPIAASNAVITHIQSLQPNALIFVYGDSTDLNSPPDIYPGSNLVWDYHLYDDSAWHWQSKLTYWQPFWDYAHAHNHAVTVGEWNVNITNDPNGFGAAIANLALTQGIANTYYNADNLLLSDNSTLTAQGLIVAAIFQEIASGGVVPPILPGTGNYAVNINGKPVFVIAGTLSIDSTIGRRSQASFSVRTNDTATHFQQYQQVLIYDPFGTTVFSGYITSPSERKPGFANSLIHTITCCDQHFLADKRVVAAAYTNQTCGFMVNDILNNILAAEGVTIGQIDPGPVIPSAAFAYCTVAAAMDALVKEASSGGVPFYWQIDQLQQLWFVPYTAVVNSKVVDGTDIEQVLSPPTVTRANPTYRNQQYITGGVAQTVVQTETRVGDGNATSWPMDYDLALVPTVSTNLNGAGYVTKTVGIRGVDTGKDFYWQQGSPDITQDSGGTKLRGPTGTIDLLKVVYTGQFPTISLDANAAQISYEQGIDGTTGIIESVVNDPTITSASNGLSEASQLLTRYAQQGVQFVFLTRRTDFAQGQLITVNYPPHGFYNAQMLVESVNASDQLDSLNIWYTVTAVQGPYDVGWVDFFSALLAQVQAANTINVGVSTSVSLLETASMAITTTMTATATIYSCPVPSSTNYPSNTNYPC